MLSIFKRIAALALLASVYIPSTSLATDLTCSIEFEGGSVDLGDPVPLVVHVRNINILTAESYTVRIVLEDNYDGEFGAETQMGSNLAPGGEAVFTFEPFYTDYTGRYKIHATVIFVDDINIANNGATVNFTVGQSSIFAEGFLKTALGENEERLDPQHGLYFGAMLAFEPGTRFTAYNDDEFSYTAENYTYFGWLDNNKYQRFAHDSWVYTQEYGKPETFKWYKISYWPQINGVDFPQDSVRGASLLRGTEPTYPTGDSSTLSNATSSLPPDDSVCVILISGHANSKYERDAFAEDINLMDLNLRLEPLGPRVQSSNVLRMIDPTAAEVIDAISTHKDKCKKLIFYYTGHGEDGILGTHGNPLYMIQLFPKLFEVGAQDLTVIIDACHSGSAIQRAKMATGYRDQNITILTSSSKDSTSYTDGIELSSGKTWASGMYTWAWARGFGSPDADYDGDGKVSEVEAHYWAMKLNPVEHGKTLDSLTRPQILIHRAVKPTVVNQPVVVPDADLEVTPKLSIGSGLSFNVGLKYSTYGDLEYSPRDTTITSVSPHREWDISLEGATNYEYDLKFKYNLSYDLLPETPLNSEPGIITYDSSKATWTAHYPSLWDEMRKTITAMSVKHFSPWAIAHVKTRPTESVDQERIVAHAKAYPNPFSNVLRIEIESDQVQRLSVSVIDATGKEVITPVAVSVTEGSYTLQLDGSTLPAGAYHAVISNEHGSQRKLIIRE